MSNTIFSLNYWMTNMKTNEGIHISDFIRMPAGTTWFFAHDDAPQLSRSIQSSSIRSGGKVECEIWVAVCPKHLADATKMVKATVVTPALERAKPGPKKQDYKEITT